MDSENNIYDGETPVHSHPTEYQSSPNNVFHHQRVRIIVGIVSILFLFGALYMVFAALEERKVSEEEIVVTPTPSSFDFSVSISPNPTPTIIKTNVSGSPTKSPTTKPTTTAAPTNTPVPIATSVPAPTNTPQPTATPAHVSNPPVINISYPSEAQYIEFTSPSQQLCVVDNPAGGNTEGLQRKHNQNDGGWSSYVTMFTYCYLPPEGSNRIQFQYKNKYGDESPVYTRQFNFHKAY